MALIKIQALLTIRKQRWLTRQVAVENGEIVRTTGPDDATAAPETPVPDEAIPLHPTERPRVAA
jgi:hyaluronan synthase